MLTKEQKKEVVKELQESLKSAKLVVFSDYRGIKVKDLSSLKKELRKTGSVFRVAKKTLIKIAFRETGINANIDNFKGQIALAFSPDEVSAPRTLVKFSKENENLKILGGIMENQEIDFEQIKKLASVPNREELLSKLVGVMKAPMTGLTFVLSGCVSSLVGVLKAISEKKTTEAS